MLLKLWPKDLEKYLGFFTDDEHQACLEALMSFQKDVEKLLSQLKRNKATLAIEYQYFAGLPKPLQGRDLQDEEDTSSFKDDM